MKRTIKKWAQERPFGDPLMVAEIVDVDTDECVDIIYHNIQTDEVWTRSGINYQQDPYLGELLLGVEIIQILTSKMEDEKIHLRQVNEIANEIIEMISKR